MSPRVSQLLVALCFVLLVGCVRPGSEEGLAPPKEANGQKSLNSAVPTEIRFVNNSGQTVSTQTVTNLQPGATYFNYNPSIDALPNGFAGAVVVQSSGAKIVGVVNELLGSGAEAGDQLFTYACANA